MPVRAIHHVTLTVADVAAAEAAYCDVFGFDVLFREGTYDDEFGAVPEDLDWPTALDAGVEAGMSFLGSDRAAIAIAERADGDVDATTTQHDVDVLDHVALHVDESDVEEMAARARDRGWDVDERESAAFLVDDDGIEWEVNASNPPPVTPFEELQLTD